MAPETNITSQFQTRESSMFQNIENGESKQEESNRMYCKQDNRRSRRLTKIAIALVVCIVVVVVVLVLWLGGDDSSSSSDSSSSNNNNNNNVASPTSVPTPQPTLPPSPTLPPNPAAFDLNKTLDQTFLGFGTQIWGYNHSPTIMRRVLEELNIRYVRVSRETALWEDLEATWAITQELGIEWVLVTWHAPPEFQSPEADTLAEIEGFAQWWVEEIAAFDLRGMRIQFIEIMNEPDSGGAWSTGILPPAYNQAVKSLRIRLDNAGYSNVGILGPGLSHLNWGKRTSRWINGLDDEAVRSLAAWSTHAWDDNDLGSGGATVIEPNLHSFFEIARARDPNKPVFVTEFASKETIFHDVTYPRADDFGGLNQSLVLPYYSATASIPYAARVYENTLALLNNGVQAAFVWQIMDEVTEVNPVGKSWGLVDLDGRPKPVFMALSTLYPKIPVGANIVQQPMEIDDNITYAAVFTTDQQVIVAIANDSDQTRNRTIVLENAGLALDVKESLAFVPVDYGNVETGTPGTGIVIEDNPITVSKLATPGSFEMGVTLPQDSTLTIVLTRGEPM